MSENRYPPDWDQRRRRVYDRDEYTCQNCGAQGGPYGDAELHAHHIVNVASGGSHDLTNLITLCADCHTATHNPGVMAPTARRESASSKSGLSWSSRNGRWWIHVLLLMFTLGVGNLLYWWWCRRQHRVQYQHRQRTDESAVESKREEESESGRRLIASIIRLGFILGGIMIALALAPVAFGFAIFYAGYTVATNRHDAFDRLQASEATRLPGLERDAPDWRVGTMTTLYLLAALAALSLLLAAL